MKQNEVKMATILSTKSIYFNDVNLVYNRPGQLKSRKNAPDELWRIIVSPMPAIICAKFVKEAAQNGLSVSIPRRYDAVVNKLVLHDIFHENKRNDNQLCFVGIKPSAELSELDTLRNDDIKDILVDMAFAGIPDLQSKLDRIAKFISVRNLMVGNIMSGSELSRINHIASQYCSKQLFIRVGISNGVACSTSDETGFGRGQITELTECFNVKQENNLQCNIISDGGIFKTGFAAKAFGAGADYVLMGGYFMDAEEAESNLNGDGSYWGGASEKEIKLEGLVKHSEGKETLPDKNKQLKPLKDICFQLWGGLSSAVSYSGYSSLTDFIGNGVFEIKQNSLDPRLNRLFKSYSGTKL